MKENLQVYGLFLNQNNTILSLATNDGYRLYETYSFKLLNEFDPLDVKSSIVSKIF